MTQGWSTTTVDAMASTSMKKDVELAQAWAAGMVEWDELPPHVQDAIDEVMAEQLTDEQAVADAMTKSEQTLNLLHKADTTHRFTLGPWYIPNKYDAHGEWTDADELQKALWEYVKSGDRDIRLQHNKDIVAGEWLEAMSFPVPVTIGMNKAEGSQQVTYPSGTVFLGVQWKPWAWELVKEGKIRGFSIGGAAARIEMAMPDDAIAKASFGGDRSAAGRYAAEQRWKGHAKGDKATGGEASRRVTDMRQRSQPLMNMIDKFSDKKLLDSAVESLKKRGIANPTLPDDDEVNKKLADGLKKNFASLMKQAEDAIAASEKASKDGDTKSLDANTKTLQKIKNKFGALERATLKEEEAKVGIPKNISENNLQTMMYASVALIYGNAKKFIDQEIKQNKGIPIWKASFGGDRSEAGRYAANQRWKGQGSSGLTGAQTSGQKATEVMHEITTRVLGRLAQARARKQAMKDEGRSSLLSRIKYVFSNDYINPEPLARKWVKEAARLAMRDETRIVDPEVASVVALPSGKQVILDRGKLTTVGKQQPTSSQVHVDTVMGGKKKRKKKPIMVDKAKSPAWQREEGKNPKGGLNAKGRASYKRDTGGTLKPPVKSGDNPRRASFLARMGNAKGPERDENGEPTRLLLSLQAWGASSKEDARRKAAAISARNKAKETKKAKGGLSEWFDEKWVDLSRPKEGGGFEECGRPDASEGKYPKCVPASTAAKMSDDERRSAIRRKRRAEAGERRKDGKPINVPTFKSKNVPTDPKLYARVKAAAKKKFDVYPSAYANAWLVQEYKRRGGGYRVEKAESLDAIVDERLAAARIRDEILAKATFGGDRSAAGRYAAMIRWQRAGSAGNGPFGRPTTRAGRRLFDQLNPPHTGSSLNTHLNYDAAGKEFEARGLNMDSAEAAEVIMKHLTPERRAIWLESIREAQRGVPTNGLGKSIVYVKGGGGASGKSTTDQKAMAGLPTKGIPTTEEDVARAKSKGEPPPPKQAVLVNSDDWKLKSADFKSLTARALKEADDEIRRSGVTDKEAQEDIRQNHLKKANAAAFVHEESSFVSKMILMSSILSGRNVVFDGTMDNGVDKRMRELEIMRQFGAKEIHGIFFSADTNEAVKRAARRERDQTSESYGRKVPEFALRDAHKKVSANFPKFVQSKVFDSVAAFDTNGRPPTLMFRQSSPTAEPEILDAEKYDKFLQKANEGGK
ncbi:MAG: hypothetical protein EBT75_00165 [Proteobacteria bacterium]|nr:hypothetical protein [Pseudomonadota bacterium]